MSALGRYFKTALERAFSNKPQSYKLQSEKSCWAFPTDLGVLINQPTALRFVRTQQQLFQHRPSNALFPTNMLPFPTNTVHSDNVLKFCEHWTCSQILDTKLLFDLFLDKDQLDQQGIICICIYIYVYVLVWINCNDLTATLLE